MPPSLYYPKLINPKRGEYFLDTLKVRMNVSIASDSWSYAPDDEVELDFDLAQAWLEIGHVTAIKGEKKNTIKLSEGVTYEGFGIFTKGGQRYGGKENANKAILEVGEVVEPNDNNAASAGADNPSGSESTLKG